MIVLDRSVMRRSRLRLILKLANIRTDATTISSFDYGISHRSSR
jgi:hypothetical protein